MQNASVYKVTTRSVSLHKIFFHFKFVSNNTMSSVHSSAVGANTQPRTSTVSSSDAPSQDTSADEGLPPQRHAGAVGLGPAYHQGPVSFQPPVLSKRAHMHDNNRALATKSLGWKRRSRERYWGNQIWWNMGVKGARGS